jgi:L-iditol 2-dehydrogenase
VLHEIPSDLAHQTTATLEPTSVAVRAVTTNSRIGAGDEVLVEGPGPIGMLSAQVARAQGADVIVTGVGQDADYRLPVADEYGFATANVADHSIDQIVADRTDGSGFDVVVDATGHPSGLETATRAVEAGGQIVLVGIPGAVEMDFSDIVRSEIEIQCSYTSLWEDFDTALELLNSGQVTVDRLIDDYAMDEPTVPFEEFKAGQTVKPMFSPPV